MLFQKYNTPLPNRYFSQLHLEYKNLSLSILRLKSETLNTDKKDNSLKYVQKFIIFT